MKFICCCTITFLILAAFSCRNESVVLIPIAPITLKPIDEYSQDARVLAARLSDDVWINVSMADEIERALKRARALRPVFDSIRASRDFVLNIVGAKPITSIGEKWKQGLIYVDDQYLDSLATTFGLTDVTDQLYGLFYLRFKQSLNIPKLASLYKQSPSIIYAEPLGFTGDGDQIISFKKSNIWHFVFSQGWGDCPSGCIYRNFFYVIVPSSGTASIVEERTTDTPPKIFRWNIPAIYLATVFTSAQDLLDHVNSDIWWERRHAVEVTWRFFQFVEPWTPWDNSQRTLWDGMKSELAAKKSEVIVLIQRAKGDPDEDVRASASLALEKIPHLP